VYSLPDINKRIKICDMSLACRMHEMKKLFKRLVKYLNGRAHIQHVRKHRLDDNIEINLKVTPWRQGMWIKFILPGI
jgi:hypothetical protein